MLQRYFRGKHFFLEEKKQWTQFFLAELTRCLQDEDVMALAVNDRESIDKQLAGVKAKYKNFTAAELQTALAALDSQDESTYTLHDATRLGATLHAAGFSRQQLATMKKSQILKYEAALFYASSNLNNLDAQYFAYQDQHPDDREEVMVDLREFRAGLITKKLKPQIQKLQKLEYAAAKAILQATLSKAETHPNLKDYGRNVLAEVEKQKNSIPLYELTEALKIASNTIVNPSEKNTNECALLGRNMMARHSTGKILGGLLQGLAGVAIVLASVAIAAVSFGVLSPVSVAGIALGASLIVGSVAVGAAIVGTGVTVRGGQLFFRGLGINKNPLKKVMANLANEAEQHRPAEQPIIAQEPIVELQPVVPPVQPPAVEEQDQADEVDDEEMADSAFGRGYQSRRL